MCTEEFIRMMFTVDLYGNRGLDSRRGPPYMMQYYLLSILKSAKKGVGAAQKTNSDKGGRGGSENYNRGHPCFV